MVPSIAVMPREGSFALASFGRVRKVQEPTFAVAAGRKSFALKRILEAVFVIFAWYHREEFAFGRCTFTRSTMSDSIPHAGSARNDKPRQGVVANTLDSYRNGAVGFIDWLDD
jgi:hypothetical protein